MLNDDQLRDFLRTPEFCRWVEEEGWNKCDSKDDDLLFDACVKSGHGSWGVRSELAATLSKRFKVDIFKGGNTIPIGMFGNQRDFTRVVLPKNIVFISDNAFGDNDDVNLHVYILNGDCELGNYVFDWFTGCVHVPEGSRVWEKIKSQYPEINLIPLKDSDYNLTTF